MNSNYIYKPLPFKKGGSKWQNFVIVIIALIFVSASFTLFYKTARKPNVNSQTKNLSNVTRIKGTQTSSLLPLLPSLVPIPSATKQVSLYLSVQNAILYDPNSGTILYEKSGFNAVSLASTAKIMTAILVLEENQLDKDITVSEKASTIIGSDIGLKQGEIISAKNLLYGLLINSGNDAATALAEGFGPGEDNFIKKANEKSQSLNLKTFNFTDPAGLDEKTVGSAFDLALLTKYALTYPLFCEIVKTPGFSISSKDGSIHHTLKNSNRLVTDEMYYEGILGVKTGFTPTAGHNLVAAAKRNGHLLIAVVLNTYTNSPTASAQAARQLLDWGFNNFIWI